MVSENPKLTLESKCSTWTFKPSQKQDEVDWSFIMMSHQDEPSRKIPKAKDNMGLKGLFF